MAEMKKLTKRDYFNELKGLESVACREDLVQFINHELELLDRKHGKSSQTKTQIENENIKETIKVALKEIGKAVTITELQNSNEDMAQYSNQKLSALLKQMVESNEVVKTTDKKKSYFSISE